MRSSGTDALGLRARVAVVTGGARGIGRAIVERLLQEGAQVVVADINGDAAIATAAELRAGGGEVMPVAVDVADGDSTRQMADLVVSTYGRIDVLVNNAGVMAGLHRRPFDEIPVDEWDRVMAVNVRGVWQATRAVAPSMRSTGRGRIINLSSDTALSGVAGLAHYTASKGAVLALTRVLARELGDDHICVNAVAPGFTLTEAALEHGGDAPARSLAQRAIKEPIEPRDVAGAVAFLASSDASLVTGQVLVVNGGYVFH